MTTPTNWPNPKQPGVPLFPERDGNHVICFDPDRGDNLAYSWIASHQVWVNYEHEGPEDALDESDIIEWVYVGPCLTPAQISEMLSGERERCARLCEEAYETTGRDFEYLGCLSCADDIRNLGDAP